MNRPLQLIYAPFAGRAELTRLIAAAGNLPITELSNMSNFGTPDIAETGESKKEYTSPSSMPLLKHGDLRLCQSGAIETYVAAIAPRFKDLTVQQRAVDNMYQGIKEDILMNCARAVRFTQKVDKDQAKRDIAGLHDKWFTIFEERVPAEGFIQGLGFPTPADLALLNIAVGFWPFGAARQLAGYDLDNWAKVKALCDRCQAAPGVAEYLKWSECTTATPVGL